MNKYEVTIVSALLKKYYQRVAKYKDTKISRRIDLPINKVLKNYSAYNVDLKEKELVNQAIRTLLEKDYINVLYLKLSEDVEKICLNIETVADLENYALKQLKLTPRSFVIDKINSLLKKYQGKGKIVDYYIKEQENLIKNTSNELDSKKVADLLKLLSFLELNQDFLYIREVSMLVFGNSKYLENYCKAAINLILFNYFKALDEDIDEDERLLKRFNVYETDQEICIKGPFVIGLEKESIDIANFEGGLSFSLKDLAKITNIQVNCKKVMTIENKTSFLRYNHHSCAIYLGGYANKIQIAFIKKLIKDNANIDYYHFGDIDAGGFWIHRTLCQQTATEFKLYHMSINELKNPRYQFCLQELTTNDITRLANLRNDPRYHECIEYMLENKVKLEQEIISLTLFKD